MRKTAMATLIAALGCGGGGTDQADDDTSDVGLSATQLAVRANHACATTNQEVWCWGRTSVAGAALSRPTPIAGTDSQSARLQVGEVDACLVNAEGSAHCWGDVTARWFADQAIDATSTLRVARLSVADVASVAGDQSALLVTTGNGQLWGIGDGRQGQLGADASTLDEPTLLELPALDRVSTGCGATCGITPDASVTCFGTMPDGFPEDTPLRAPPTSIDGVTEASDLSVGCGFACALHGAGSISCWGSSKATPSGSYPARSIESLPAIVAVAAGGDHACALDGEGGVWCWGEGSGGQLGNGSKAASAQPVRVVDLPRADEIAVGATFSCARAGSQLFCWGNGDQLGLGGGQPETRASPQRVLLLRE